MTSAILFSVASVLSTLGGGLLLVSRKDWTEQRLRRLLAFGSGVLLGITFLHLLPEAWSLNARWAGGSALAAFIVFFLVEQFTVLHACAERLEEGCHVHSLGYGALAALFTHGVADGLAMAFAFLHSASLGFVVSSALIVHKFSDGITLSGLFLDEGHSRGKTLALTGALAVATPLGVLAGLAGAERVTPTLMSAFLAFAAGGFLYVSAADILPRLHKSRDAWCWIFLIVGMSLSLAVRHP